MRRDGDVHLLAWGRITERGRLARATYEIVSSTAASGCRRCSSVSWCRGRIGRSRVSAVSTMKHHSQLRLRELRRMVGHSVSASSSRRGYLRLVVIWWPAYLNWGELVDAPLLAAREEMPGSCVRLAEADVEVELGLEIGSIEGGGSICGPSSIVGFAGTRLGGGNGLYATGRWYVGRG